MQTYCLIRSIFVFDEETGAVVKLRRGATITASNPETYKGIIHGLWGRHAIMMFASDLDENALHAEAWWANRVL